MMSEIMTHTESIMVNANRYDPTRTIGLRNAFAKDMRKRFRELVRVIRRAIIEENCFGLQMKGVIAFQMTTPGPGAFAFPRSADKVNAFMKWLQTQVDRGIIETTEITQIGGAIEQPWTNKYIKDSYKRGVLRARYEMKKVGMDVPSVDMTGGIELSMSTPFHIDRLGLLYSRAFTGLKGITTAMDTQISRVLAQGIADGDGPRFLARKLVATINGVGMGDLAITDTLGRFIPASRRAEMLARTEIIRAHHQAMIQEYKNWGVEGVIVQAEWITAGDSRVCSACESMVGNGPMQGGAYALDQINGMIPKHPRCRCIALPFKGEAHQILKKDLDIRELQSSEAVDYDQRFYSSGYSNTKQWKQINKKAQGIRNEKLTQIEKLSLEYYERWTYQQINRALNLGDSQFKNITRVFNGFNRNIPQKYLNYSPEQLSNFFTGYEKLLKSTLKKLPKAKGSISYRSMNFETKELMEKVIQKYLSGGDVIAKSYWSTSIDSGISNMFTKIGGNNIQLMIEGNSNRVLGESYTETIFLPKSKFKVIEITKFENTYYVKLQEL